MDQVPVRRQITIPLELTITMGDATKQSRFRLTMGGNEVFDGYETHLPEEERSVIKKIIEAHGKQMQSFAAQIR